MMPTPVVAAVEEACGPGASTVAAIVAARFTPAGSTAVADTAIASEAHDRAIRSPVVRAVQVTPLPVGQVVRSLVIPGTATAAQPTVLPPGPPQSAPMDTTTTTTIIMAVIRTPTAIGSVRSILTSIDTENALLTVGTVVRWQ
jgi:hypothetical protein